MGIDMIHKVIEIMIMIIIIIEEIKIMTLDNIIIILMPITMDNNKEETSNTIIILFYKRKHAMEKQNVEFHLEYLDLIDHKNMVYQVKEDLEYQDLVFILVNKEGQHMELNQVDMHPEVQ